MVICSLTPQKILVAKRCGRDIEKYLKPSLPPYLRGDLVKDILRMSKIIMCIDMDAFFASVEQQSNPKLMGKPIAVIGSGGRTIITTRSYEARKYGVKTGMNIYEAKKVCPHIIFVIGNNEKYTHL